MPAKVLIVYATGGMGHVTAAKATKSAFQKHYPDVEIKSVDVIDFANAFYRKVFVGGYNYISAHFPNMWGWLYRRYNDKSRQKLPSLVSRWAIEKRFINFIKAFKPDFIISTHPLPMLLISHSKHTDVISVFSSLVVTDYGCHSFWADQEVNFYFVATQDVGKCLQGYGIKPDKIVVTGIPIEPKFSTMLNKEKIITTLQLDSTKKTVLIVGGQFNFGTLKKILREVSTKHQHDTQFLVVAGRDRALKEALEKSSLDTNKHIRVFGFVDNMQELMTVSDVMFSKAGGLTVSEALAKGLPLIIHRVIPGQEEDNVEYLVEKGVAVKVDSTDDLIVKVNGLLAQPAELDCMKEAAQKLGRPHAARDLAAFVTEKIT